MSSYTLWQGGQDESWLFIKDGKIIQHTENDGYACLRNGAQPHEQELTMKEVENIAKSRGKPGLVAWVQEQLLREVKSSPPKATYPEK